MLLASMSRLVGAAANGEAALPAGVALNWDKSAVIELNARRAEAALDGIWQFLPAVEEGAEPPNEGWGYIKVPGDWQVHPIRPSSIVMTRASIIASGVLIRSMLAGCPGGPSTA